MDDGFCCLCCGGFFGMSFVLPGTTMVIKKLLTHIITKILSTVIILYRDIVVGSI